MGVLKGIGEYLTMVKNGIKNRDKIIEGFWVAAQMKKGNGKITEEAIAEIMKRKDICKSCPFNSKNAARDRGYKSDLPFEHCTLCLCRIGGTDTKEYCLSCECGISELNKRNAGSPPLKLMWEKFQQPETDNNKTNKDDSK